MMYRFGKWRRVTAGILLAASVLSMTALAQSAEEGSSSLPVDTGESQQTALMTLSDTPPTEVDSTPIEPEPLPEPAPPLPDTLEPRAQLITSDDTESPPEGALSTEATMVLGVGIAALVLLVGLLGGRGGRAPSKQL